MEPEERSEDRVEEERPDAASELPDAPAALPPARDLWQIPGIVVAVVIILVAAYIVRHPVTEPSSEEADFEALLMAYKQGDTIASGGSAERFLARYPASSNEPMARFIFADSKWDLIRSDPATTPKDLASCLDSYQRALTGGIPPEQQAAALKARGDILLRMGLPNEALSSYTRLLECFPEETDALLRAAVAHMLVSPPSPTKAGEYIDLYLAREDLTVKEIQKGYLAKARLAAAKGDHARARDNARGVLNAGSDGEVVAEARLILARALSSLGDDAGALGVLRDTEGPAAGRFESSLNLALAIALWKNGMIDEARRAFDDTIFRFPGTAEALGARYELAALLRERGQIEAARDSLFSLLDDMSAQETLRTEYFEIDQVAELWFSVGREILSSQGTTAAQEYHAAALALMSEGHLLFFKGALYLREAEQIEAALPGLPIQKKVEAEVRLRDAYAAAGATFVKVLETSSGSIFREALFEAGHSFYKGGEYTSAVPYLLEFTRLESRDRRVAQALYEASQGLVALGDGEQAIAICARNVANHPFNIYAYRAMVLQADLYGTMGGEGLADAAGLYEGILTDRRFETDSREWRTALFALGRTLYMLERYEEAMLRLEEAIGRFPADPSVEDARYYLAHSFRQAGLRSSDLTVSFLARAAEIFSSIAAGGEKVDPDRAREAAFFEADCYYDVGDYSRAIAYYDRAAEAHVDTPEATRALFQIANCYWHLGSADKAAAMYRRATFNLDRQGGKVFPDGEYYKSIARWRAGDRI
ncbi:MAG: tetratricopeptide repeat protein [Planctomycetota bacterium]